MTAMATRRDTWRPTARTETIGQAMVLTVRTVGRQVSRRVAMAVILSVLQ